MAGTKMKKAKGVSFAKLDWDLKTPQMWKAINKGHGDDEVVQDRFYDGNAKSWAADIHPNGTEPSTLVAALDYNGGDKTLTVTYRDGFKATYHDIEPELAEEFSKADSKGRWALANLWDRAYS